MIVADRGKNIIYIVYAPENVIKGNPVLSDALSDYLNGPDGYNVRVNNTSGRYDISKKTEYGRTHRGYRRINLDNSFII